MQSNLILTTAQAQAVYSAMCALKVVDGTRFQIAFGLKLARQHCGRVVYVRDEATGSCEEFADQDTFASEYGLSARPERHAALIDSEGTIEDPNEAIYRSLPDGPVPDWFVRLEHAPIDLDAA